MPTYAERYLSPVVSRHWLRDDGKRASIYGAAPYYTEAEKSRWQIVESGYVIADSNTNTVGQWGGGKVFDTMADCQAAIDAIAAKQRA